MASDSIVVDIPERISFELRIPVIDPGSAESEEMDAGDSSYVFNRMGHEDFPRSLRTITVSARREEDLLKTLGRIDLARCFTS